VKLLVADPLVLVCMRHCVALQRLKGVCLCLMAHTLPETMGTPGWAYLCSNGPCLLVSKMPFSLNSLVDGIMHNTSGSNSGS